jgi:TatA/E family protein of Tat protein translocase
MFGSFGAPEIIIIALVVVLLFGVGKISGLGRELGSSIKEFRKAVKDPDEEAARQQQLQAQQAPPQVQQPQYAPPPPQQQYAPPPPQPQYTAPAPAPQQQPPSAPQQGDGKNIF